LDKSITQPEQNSSDEPTDPILLNCFSNTHSSSESNYIPIVRSVDKASSSLPNNVTMSEDFIRASVGFRRIDTIKKCLSTLYLDTIKLDVTPLGAILDSGYLVTMKKKDWNTHPVPRPKNFGDIFHMDIVFDPEIAIGNIHCGLLFRDQFSCMTYLYPLQNLTSDIKKQMEAFFCTYWYCAKNVLYLIFIQNSLAVQRMNISTAY
jgi:hypothetical protein